MIKAAIQCQSISFTMFQDVIYNVTDMPNELGFFSNFSYFQYIYIIKENMLKSEKKTTKLRTLHYPFQTTNAYFSYKKMLKRWKCAMRCLQMKKPPGRKNREHRSGAGVVRFQYAFVTH